MEFMVSCDSSGQTFSHPTNSSMLRAVLLILLGLSGQLLAQRSCGFDQLLQAQISRQPEVADRLLTEEQQQYEAWHPSLSGPRSSCDIVTIPVVFHLVYQSASANISDAQILSQLTVLNQDYRRIDASPGDGPGADTQIEFCLAGLDPLGNPSTGITRHNSPLAIHKTTEEDLLKQLIAWDDQRYLNIWIVESITLIDPNGQLPSRGILAYASYPTLPNGQPQGVVIANRYVGTTGSVVAPFAGGRTLTHEIGHYLGLFHPFESEGTCSGASESNCSSGGDRVCDTPSQLNPTFGCPPSSGNSCKDTPCDAPDPDNNYLNYTDDACMNAFTEGQAARMRFFLSGARSSLVAPANLISTGCLTTPVLNQPHAAFAASSSVACIGESVSFTDQSQGCPDTWSWSFPGGVPATSALASPVVTYTSPGSYPVMLVVSNDSGSDTMIRSSHIRVSTAEQASGWQQGFESILFPPQGWHIQDEDELGSWLRTNLAARSGQFSAIIPHFLSPSCGQQDLLISPPIEMSGKPWELSFSYAYQTRNSDPNDADELEVAISDACGSPWLPVFFRAGKSLATVEGNLDTGPFVPKTSDWKTIVIDLSEFADRSHVRIRFRSKGRGGQNLYLDNIRLRPSSFVSIDLELEKPDIFPNPVTDRLTIRQPAWAGQQIEVQLVDVQGRIVEQRKARLNTAGEITWTPLMVSGLYVLRVRQEDGPWYSEMLRCE